MVKTLVRVGGTVIFVAMTLVAPILAMENLDRSRTTVLDTDAPAFALLETCFTDTAAEEEQDCGLPIVYYYNITLCYLWGLHCYSFGHEHVGESDPCEHWNGTLDYWLGESCWSAYLGQCQCGNCS